VALRVFLEDTATRYRIGSRTKVSEPFGFYKCVLEKSLFPGAGSELVASISFPEFAEKSLFWKRPIFFCKILL